MPACVASIAGDASLTAAESDEQHLDLALRLFLRLASQLSRTTLICFDDNYSKEAVMQVRWEGAGQVEGGDAREEGKGRWRCR